MCRHTAKKAAVKIGTEGPYSRLYHRIHVSRIVIPSLAAIGVLFFEVFEHGIPFHPVGWTPIVDIAVFGLAGPAATFLVLTWLLHRVRERDEAEARLAQLAAHEQELLSQLERFVRAERFGLIPTLESILEAIAEETSISGGAVCLLGETGGEDLTATVSWPTAETGAQLVRVVREAGQGAQARPAADDGSVEIIVEPDQRVLSVPISDHGETLALLLLGGPADAAPPNIGVLGVVAGALALLIRNNQLYARLQSQAVIDERQELAREVHDGLAQSLGFLNFKAQQVKRLLDRGDTGQASIALDELCEGSREVYEEVRVLIRSLRSSVVLAGGLIPSLEQYCALVSRRTGLEITILADEEPDLSQEAQLQVFRVVQEALNNAYRHGMARHVSIQLSDGVGCVDLSVIDDGLGLPAPTFEAAQDAAAPASLPLSKSEEHFGLRIMRERVQSIGGELQVESREDVGTTVRIRLPAGCPQPQGAEVA